MSAPQFRPYPVLESATTQASLGPQGPQYHPAQQQQQQQQQQHPYALPQGSAYSPQAYPTMPMPSVSSSPQSSHTSHYHAQHHASPVPSSHHPVPSPIPSSASPHIYQAQPIPHQQQSYHHQAHYPPSPSFPEAIPMDEVPAYSGPSAGYIPPPQQKQTPLPFPQPMPMGGSSTAAAPPPRPVSTQAQGSANPMSEITQKVLPNLPSFPVRTLNVDDGTGTTLILGPLPFGWSVDSPQGEMDPMQDFGVGPRNGYQNVHWHHAFPDLNCDGGCGNKFAFASRIRYTCVTCPQIAAFDLCEGCFERTDAVERLHNPNHEMLKMDLAFPEWGKRAWNAGMVNLQSGSVVAHMGAKTLMWGEGYYKKGDLFLEDLVMRRMLILEEVKTPKVIEMDGLDCSFEGMLHLVLAAQATLEEVTFRSGPKFGGQELCKIFMGFFDQMPDAFPNLHTIRAIGCNFFDFRTNIASKKVDYAKIISQLFEKSRLRQKAQQEQWINNLHGITDEAASDAASSGACCGLFGSSKKSSSALSKKKTPKPHVRAQVKIEFSICDGKMSTPCGFPGLVPELWTSREPINCFNSIRDITLFMVQYLGDPERVLDPVAERTRVLNKRKMRMHTKLVKMLGGPQVMNEIVNRFLNEYLDRCVNDF